MKYNEEFWSIGVIGGSGIFFPTIGLIASYLVFGTTGWQAAIIMLISGFVGFIGLSYLWSKVKTQAIPVRTEQVKE